MCVHVANVTKWDKLVGKIVSDILSRNTWVALKRAVWWSVLLVGNCLTSESVQGSTLSLHMAVHMLAFRTDLRFGIRFGLRFSCVIE